MRVIFVTTVFDDVQTGPGLYAQILWRAFCDDPDLEFHVVALSARQQHPRLHTVGAQGGSRACYRRIQQAARELAEPDPAGTIVHGNAAHSMYRFADYAGPWAVQINDYEVATHWRGWPGKLRRLGPRGFAGRAWRHWREARAVASAWRVVCNSEYTRRRVLDAYPVAEDRAVTIYKSVSVGPFARPAVLPPDPLPDRPRGGRLAFVGSNWSIKGLDVLLEALRRLAGRFDEVSLAVAGPADAPANARIAGRAGTLGVAERVHFLGRVPREALSALLWHSDVFVLPSRQEAFGVAVVEALAAGLPVVASRVGGIPEILADGEFGLLCEPDDPAALADAVGTLLGDEARRAALAERAGGRARRFDADRMIRQVRGLYADLARGPDAKFPQATGPIVR